MIDIVSELRKAADSYSPPLSIDYLLREAADEIERLRAENTTLTLDRKLLEIRILDCEEK